MTAPSRHPDVDLVERAGIDRSHTAICANWPNHPIDPLRILALARLGALVASMDARAVEAVAASLYVYTTNGSIAIRGARAATKALASLLDASVPPEIQAHEGMGEPT